MTVDQFNIKRVAIIGGGVSGIGALNELIHTAKDGSTGFGQKDFEPAFETIVLFERNDTLGGNWHYTDESDPIFPDQDTLNSGLYNKPEVLDPPLNSIPNDLLGTSVESPIIKKHDDRNRWSNSAAYPALFSNIIAPLVRLPSGLKYYQQDSDRHIHPYSTAGEIHRDLLKVVKEYNLIDNIRFSTTVERLTKNGNEWELILKKTDGKNDYWYLERFDAVITANGHYNIPFIPLIENLSQYNNNHTGDLLHTKGIKNFDQFKDKDILIIGSHASSVDVIKFLVGNAKSITVSRRTMENDSGTGIDIVFEQPEIQIKPKIRKFQKESIEFVDDSFGQYDKVIFATGYHFHYPFLVDSNLVELGQISDENSKYSLIKNLYLYTFAIQDPTFATIGIQQTAYLFATMESQATAIAGVWSNYSKLPSAQDQYRWVSKRNEDRVYHIFTVETAQSLLADALVELAPQNRKHPFDIANVSQEEVKEGFENVLRVYKLFRDGELTYDKVRFLDNSKKAVTYTNNN